MTEVFALFGLGFPLAPSLRGLNLPHNATRRFILQKARRHPVPKDVGLRLLVSDGFQVLFHSPPGVLFTFPSRYWFTVGGQECLALEGGPPRFPQGFSCPGVLGILSAGRSIVRYRALTVYGSSFQRTSRDGAISYLPAVLTHRLESPTTPNRQRRQAWHRFGLGSPAFARRYLRDLG